MNTLALLSVCAVAGGGLFGLYLAIKGVVSICRRQIKSGIAYLLAGIPLALLVAGLLLPAVASRPRSRKRPLCMRNLSQIAKGCIMYSMDSDEAFPPSFSALTTNYISNPKTFVCDASGHKPGSLASVDQWTDYVLITNTTAGSSSQLVLAYCKPENHDGKGCNVVFVDGSVAWFQAENFHNIPCDVVNHSRVSRMPQQPSPRDSSKAADGLTGTRDS